MTSSSTLIGQISDLLGKGIVTNYSSSSEANDVFEGYTFSIIVEAARAAGGSVTFETNDGAKTTNLIFRTSPGDIFSTKHKYTHAVIEFPKCPALEAHIGVKVWGRSKVLHECDVAVIERQEGQICRASKVHPRAAKVQIVAECKFYSCSLKLGLAREYLGLIAEVNKRNRFLVSNASSENAARIITHHDAKWEFDLEGPSSASASDLTGKFKESFRNYIAAKHS